MAIDVATGDDVLIAAVGVDVGKSVGIKLGCALMVGNGVSLITGAEAVPQADRATQTKPSPQLFKVIFIRKIDKQVSYS